MSDTPRTKAAADRTIAENDLCVIVAEMAQLERELVAKDELIDKMARTLVWAEGRTTPDRTVSEEVWGSVPPTPVEEALALLAEARARANKGLTP